MQKVIKHSFIYMAGEILAKMAPFIILPYLTRKLSVEGFGELSLYLSCQALFAVFVSWSFEGAIARYYYRYGRYGFFSITAYAILLTSSIFLLVLFFMPGLIYKLIWFSAFLTALFNILITTFQCQKKPFFYVMLQLFLASTGIVLTFLFFSYFSATAQLRIIVIVIATMVSVIVAGYLAYNKSFIQHCFLFDKRFVFYLLGFGFPLIFHHLNFFFKGQFDRVLIAESFDMVSLGIYSAGFQLASVFSVLLQAVNKACVPFFYEQCKQGKMDVVALVKFARYSLFFVPIPALLAWCVPTVIYSLFLGEAYGQAKVFTCIFLLGLGVQIPYLILVNYLFYLNQNKKIALCTFLSSLVHIFLLFIFREISIYALPFALFGSNVLTIILLYFLITISEPVLTKIS